MRAMVFAAGLGTRLRPMTSSLPKPVVPLGNRPLAWFALSHLARAGARHAVLNAFHLADAVGAAVAQHPVEGLETLVVREASLLGTGGGLKHAVAAQSRALGSALPAGEALVAMNGDVLFAPDVAGAIALHRRLGAYATMVLRPDANAARYGSIEIDGSGRVGRLLGEPKSARGALTPMMFTGVHVLSAAAIADLPDEGCIVRLGYRRWVDRGEVVAGFVDESSWRDLGTPAEYLAANVDLATGRVRWPGVEPVGANLVAAGARVEGATLQQCVVGAGAHVAAGVALHRCVVWPGVSVSQSASDAVLWQRG